jgi:hypothetical protein
MEVHGAPPMFVGVASSRARCGRFQPVAKCSLRFTVADTTAFHAFSDTFGQHIAHLSLVLNYRAIMPQQQTPLANAWQDDWESIADVCLPLLVDCARSHTW